MKNLDWGLLKIQYEIFGETIDSLAEEYDTTPRMIQFAVDEGGWEKKPLANAITEWQNMDNLEAIPPDLIDQVKDRMQILFTLKQSALNPRYIAIETALLGKVQQVVQNLSPDNENAAEILKSIANVFIAMKGVVGLGERADDKMDNSIKVQVLQRIDRQGTAGVEQSGVQVEIDGVKRCTPEVRGGGTPTPQELLN